MKGWVDSHRDRNIHIERACQEHSVNMTRHGLLQIGLTLADKAECSSIKNFEALMKKQPNLGYADVKLVFLGMLCTGWGRRFSQCEYYYLYGHGHSFAALGNFLRGLAADFRKRNEWDSQRWKQTSYLEAEWNARHADLSWPAAAYLRRTRNGIRTSRIPAVHLVHDRVVIFRLYTRRSWNEIRILIDRS